MISKECALIFSARCCKIAVNFEENLEFTEIDRMNSR